MPLGDFVVGRSTTCHLALDDALVSRRHATIEVRADGTSIEDLGSRNGTLVNGSRIQKKQELMHLDRITIGAHDLVFLVVTDRASSSPPGARTRAITQSGSPTLTGATIAPPRTLSPRFSSSPHHPEEIVVREVAPTARHDVVAPMASIVSAPAPPSDPGEELTGAALLTGIADKALALGRFDEAERVLSRSLQDLLTLAKVSPRAALPRVREGTRYALKLAEGTKRTSWVDWAFELHTITGSLMTADEIERIHELVRKLRYREIATVRRYLDVIRARAGDLGPTEKFLLQRLEGVERMVAA